VLSSRGETTRCGSQAVAGPGLRRPRLAYKFMGNPERLVGAEVANLAAAIERAAADLAMTEEPAGFTVALEGENEVGELGE